ncbi:hypothetical protein SAMN05444365_101395 [Micromonospora pattaloongensis]|uniref:Transposase n=1 Tax=Micromonospora pattaloongensis TaxID=405436 RepID=A0A1H3GHB4_9ACTN|nr:hypothetical protein SAMN05444365_101395 [Micromonospora pattaloongensis]
MALVRVYCGLASADSAAGPASAGSLLTAAVVDDAGRLLDVCEISDDPAGYARLGALLVERSSGPSGAAIAADSDDHVVTSLLTAAGRPLAIADDDAVDDYAERFADDESADEIESPAAERRAVGLARALQAGALSAVTLPAPRDLASFKPVLAAHAALANGRHAAAVALREVLRELYPAALRAYPDPAEPLALAVLDALPEPGILATAGRGRDAAVAADAVAAQLAADGIADADAVADAVTALRVAIGETPRRAATTKALTASTAETVRHAVAAVRACDSGCEALIATVASRVAAPAPVSGRRAARRAAAVAPVSAPPGGGLHSTRPTRTESAPARVPTGGRRARPEPVTTEPVAPQPMTAPPVAPAPVAPPPAAPRPVAPAAALSSPLGPLSAPPSTEAPAAHRQQPPVNRPVSAPPPPPPGMTPIVPGQRPSGSPADAGEPFRPTLTTAAINSARAERERQRLTPIPPRPAKAETPPPSPSQGFGATDLTVPVPVSRPSAADTAPPGSRARWPLVTSGDDRVNGGPGQEEDAYPRRDRPGSDVDMVAEPSVSDRVRPPWLADDLPPEPPVLRLVEAPLAERALRDDLSPPRENGHLDAPPLRLVDSDALDSGLSRASRDEEQPAAPIPDEGDGDLLIFAAARSAWFVGHSEEDEESGVDWSTSADTGWRAAEQAAKPSIGSDTKAGLPRRVPQANLVPGSPLREERPLRIVRDPASIAAHTTGYFQGWRRGQEIGGYAVGGRPGRESGGGWDFSRDQTGRDESREFEYRSAGYRS